MWYPLEKKPFGTHPSHERTTQVEAHTAFVPIKYKPVWTIKKFSEDHSGYFQIVFLCAKSTVFYFLELFPFSLFYLLMW